MNQFHSLLLRYYAKWFLFSLLGGALGLAIANIGQLLEIKSVYMLGIYWSGFVAGAFPLGIGIITGFLQWHLKHKAFKFWIALGVLCWINGQFMALGLIQNTIFWGAVIYMQFGMWLSWVLIESANPNASALSSSSKEPSVAGLKKAEALEHRIIEGLGMQGVWPMGNRRERGIGISVLLMVYILMMYFGVGGLVIQHSIDTHVSVGLKEYDRLVIPLLSGFSILSVLILSIQLLITSAKD